jgi:uncharacterized protein YuzE
LWSIPLESHPRPEPHPSGANRTNARSYFLKQLSEYLRLDDSRIIESEEVSPGVVLDFNADNQVVGVEILNLSKRSPNLNLRELQFQTDKS